MKIKENIPLGDYTTFRVGGPARFLIEAGSVTDLKDAVLFAREKKLPIFVLGGGSNVLVSDFGFSGVVIRPQFFGTSFLSNGRDFYVNSGASEEWDKLVSAAVLRGLWGIENLSYIPGSVGGAPIQNIGAYGQEFKDTAVEVDVFDTDSLDVKKINAKDCNFSYRHSFFKEESGKKYIVIGATLSLSPFGQPNLSYKDLKEYFIDNKKPQLKEIRDAVIEIRKRKLPDVKDFGTAGSFFKNPTVSREFFENLNSKYGELSGIWNGNFVKISAAFLIDRVAGMRGYREGGVGVWEKQPLALVNYGGGTQKEVEMLAKKIKEKIFDETGINLEQEVIDIPYNS